MVCGRNIAEGKFLGAFTWPGSVDVFVFHQSQNQTRYSIVKEASNLIDWRIRRLIDLEGWLKATVGVSL